MNKKFVLILVLLLVSSVVTNAATPPKNPPSQPNTSSTASSGLDKDRMYYPNANINSAMNKYKDGNYTGSLQELFSLTLKDPSNALAYYYMAMAYTHLDMQAEAIEAYEKVIALSSNEFLTQYAVKGRDCLTDGPACVKGNAEDTIGNIQGDLKSEEKELDNFINSPFGSGMSQEMSEAVKRQELSNFKKTINKKQVLPPEDIQKIRDFDAKNSHKSSNDDDTIKIAQVSNEEILQAVQTLKDAGLTLNVQSAENPYAMMYQDPKMAEVSMLLGNNNNYYNNNSMMNMLPFLMSQAKNGQNIDPRFMQTMMMNSMMSDLNFNNNNNNRY